MVDKILERLEERRNDVEYMGNDDDYFLGKSSGFGEAIEIVQEVAKEYEPCYKDCAECEAYDKVKHNCPKFCKVIKETVKEYSKDTNVRSNADRIRSMSDEELAEFLKKFDLCTNCRYGEDVRCTFENPCTHGFATAMAYEWLKSEVKE